MSCHCGDPSTVQTTGLGFRTRLPQFIQLFTLWAPNLGSELFNINLKM